VALRLLLLGRSYPEGRFLLEFEGTRSGPSEPDDEEEEEGGHAGRRYGFAGSYMADRESRNVSYCR
jgi:hypothetical protein